MKQKRIFKEEPKKRFDLERFIPELFQKIDRFEKEADKLGDEINYKIEFIASFERKDLELLEKAGEKINKILIPYFLVRKKQGKQKISLKTSPIEADETHIFLPVSIESSGRNFYNCKRKIATEISGILLPEELQWNVGNTLKVSFILSGEERTVYDSVIPETNRFSAFDMSVDKEMVLKHYSEPIVQDVIKRFCEGRYVRIKFADGCEKPKMRMWLKYKKELLPPPKSPEDFENYVKNYNMIQIYTSVDRIGENFPSIFVIETDIGDMLKIIDIKKAHALSFEIISKISNFLRKYEIENYIHLSGNRSFHIWTGSLEKPTEVYEEILNSMGIEDENLRSPYGELRILGKAIAVHLIREMDEKSRKKFSIERENVFSKNYRILVDVLSSQKCAIGCPLSLHASSGLVYTRPFGKGLDEYFKEYENYKSWCEPSFAISYAKKYPQIYSEIVPYVKRESFEKLSEDLKKEIVLVLHTSKIDPNVKPDYSFFVSEYQAEKIYKEYFN